jgi:hypothetical protein
MKTTKIFFFFFILIIMINACKKDKPQIKLGSLNISDAYALVLCRNDSVNSNPEDTLKLYKITADDRFYRVQFYAEDDANLGFTYHPVAMYDINKNYFLFIVSKDGSGTTESYIVHKSDGTAEEIKDFVVPRINQGIGTIINPSNRLFNKANENIYFYIDENQINRLSFDAVNYPTTKFIGDYVSDFAVDSLGDFFLGRKVYYQSYDSGNDLIAYPVNNLVDQDAIVCGNLGQGFYTVQRNTTQVLIKKLLVNDANCTLLSKGEIAENIVDWNYLGSASFSNSQSVILVFDLGLLYITPATEKIVPLSNFSMGQILDFSQSNQYLYIHGFNLLQNELFAKINPTAYPLTFSHIFNPDQYHYYQYQLDELGNFSFFAKRNADEKEVIGYLSASQFVNIVENDQQLEPQQILSIK